MRIEIPTYGHFGGKLKYGGGSAYIYDKEGKVTWKYSGPKHNGVGVVSCVRSGSQYTTKVLHNIGLNVGHEYQGPDGSVGYHLAVIRPKNCFHQVRHPLRQISSNMAHQSWGFTDQVISLPNKKLLGCMQYWLIWNQMCEDFCVWRYQIEEFPNVWDEFLERIEHEKCELPDVPTDTNKHYKPVFQYTWADLFEEDRELAQEIVDMAERYGYEVPETAKRSIRILGNWKQPAQVASV